ncbi:MAG: hypothetical protein ACTSRS_18750 [Candidatus Helarchaeota archaeon]
MLKLRTPAEVIAEGLISSIESKEPKEVKGPLKVLRKKCIQINFPNLHEAIVIYFNESKDNEIEIKYEIYTTPIFRCQTCKWKGSISDLPTEEKLVIIKNMKEIVWEKNELMNPTIRKIRKICPNCGSENLIQREYRHRGRDLWIIGSHQDIAKLGTLVDPVIPHRVNGLINAFWSYFVTEKIKFRPLWQIRLAIQFGRLLL